MGAIGNGTSGVSIGIAVAARARAIIAGRKVRDEAPAQRGARAPVKRSPATTPASAKPALCVFDRIRLARQASAWAFRRYRVCDKEAGIQIIVCA